MRGIQGYLSTYNNLYRHIIGREVPARRARGEMQDAESVLNISYTFILSSVVVESAVLAGVGFLVQDNFLRLAFFTVAIINIFETIAITDTSTLVVTTRFHALAVGRIASSTLQASMLITFSWLWGFHGYFLALALGAIVSFVVFRLVLRRGWWAYISLAFRWQTIREVFPVGMSITAFWMVRQLMVSVDRFFIVAFLGLTELGFYSLGTTMTTVVLILPTAAVTPYMPRMIGFASTGRLDRVEGGARKLYPSVALAAALAFGWLTLVLRPLIEWVLPDYHDAVPALEVMFLGGYLAAMLAVAANLHIVLLRLRRATLYTLIGAASAALLSLLLVRFGLVGVASATTTAIGINTLLLTSSLERFLNAKKLVLWLLIGLLLLGAVYGVLYEAGRGVALLYLMAITGGAFWYLTRLHGIHWREVPRLATQYLLGRSKPAVSGTGDDAETTTE